MEGHSWFKEQYTLNAIYTVNLTNTHLKNMIAIVFPEIFILFKFDEQVDETCNY